MALNVRVKVTVPEATVAEVGIYCIQIADAVPEGTTHVLAPALLKEPVQSLKAVNCPVVPPYIPKTTAFVPVTNPLMVQETLDADDPPAPRQCVLRVGPVKGVGGVDRIATIEGACAQQGSAKSNAR